MSKLVIVPCEPLKIHLFQEALKQGTGCLALDDYYICRREIIKIATKMKPIVWNKPGLVLIVNSFKLSDV
jgi:hypothetical protein